MGENPDGTSASGYNSHEVLAGTNYADWIDAGDGDDAIYGDGGDDVLDGKAGADHIYGGDGQDVIFGGDIEDFLNGQNGDDIVYAGTSAGALDVVIGGVGNDSLYGEAGIDELYGRNGDDYIDAGGDTDLAFGDNGNDRLYGGDGPDALHGGTGSDIISGGSGPDALFGEAGDDILLAGIGQGGANGDSDEALGGDNFDLVSFSDSTVVLNVAADLRNQNLTAANGATPFTPFNQLWSAVEGLIGSKFADTIIGADGTAAAADNWLVGGGGNDSFRGLGGNDVIVGDQIRLDTLIGKYNGTYDQYAEGASHRNSGTLGNGLLNNNSLGTGMFNKHFDDLLKSEAAKNTIFGDDGGSAGNNDTVSYSGNYADYHISKIVFAGTTVYKIEDLRAGAPDGVDLVTGVDTFAFADQVLSESDLSNDSPTGSVSFTPGQSGVNALLTPIATLFDADNINGSNPSGAVTQPITFNWQRQNGASWTTVPTGTTSGTQTAAHVLTQAATAGTVVHATATYTDAKGHQNTATSASWNLIVGNNNANSLDGTTSTSLADVVFGLNGNDQLTGNGGEDTLIGGSGADNLTGGANNDLLLAGAGNDTVVGGGGDDTLDSGSGTDNLAGNNGDDTYIVSTAATLITEAQNEGNDVVLASVTTTLSVNVERLTLTGFSNINGTGNALDNTLIGNSGNNVLDGRAGNDTMTGGDGDDRYVVDSSQDSIIENSGGGNDTVTALVASYTLGAQVENLIGSGNAAQTLTGNAGDNKVTGAGGADVLAGSDGADTLEGLGGDDTLTGGNGADRFVFGNNTVVSLNNLGIDVISDFVSEAANAATHDVIAVDNATNRFAAVGPDGALAAGAFYSSASGTAHDADDRIIYNTANGWLTYDSNGSANGGTRHFATLDPGLTLSAHDFLVL